jgi:hypothetical protein
MAPLVTLPSLPYRRLHHTSSRLWPLDERVGSVIIGQLLQHHGLDSPVVTEWVADSGASNHTTSVGDATLLGHLSRRLGPSQSVLL